MTTVNEAVDGRVLIREGFVWDMQDAYLFDIDGTLLRSRDRIHFNSFSESIRAVTGLDVTLDGVVLHGGTDTAILAEAFELAGVGRDVWEPHNEAILETMRRMVIGRRSEMNLWTMPAAAETVEYLASKGALLGLATGNLEAIGWVKVELVGLRHWFRFGGFSDRFVVRADMVADAVAQARALLQAHPILDRAEDRMGHPGSRLTGKNGAREFSICVVGDTPRDIQAARANGLPVIAVATGNYSFDELAALEPEVCASSLAVLMAGVAR